MTTRCQPTVRKLFPYLMSFACAIALFLSMAQSTLAGEPEIHDLAEIKVGAKTAFMVTGIKSISAQDRGDIINRRIEKILTTPALDPAEIHVEVMKDGTPAVTLGGLVIAGATIEDSEVFDTDSYELAEHWSYLLKSRITQLKPLYDRASKHQVTVLSEQRVLLLILQVGVLLFAACVCGELMSRIGQPPVIGQLLAGIILGQSGLGYLFPEIAGIVFPVEKTQSYLLEVVSWLGVIFLLMLTGLETDLGLIRRQGRPALWTSILGLVLPFAIGFGVSYVLPESLLIDPSHRFVVSLFLGTVLSVSSVPVIAKILMDMQLMRRNVGQLIIAAALCHDMVGTIILGLVAALAGNEALHGRNPFMAPLGTILFILIAYLGRHRFFALLRWVNDKATMDQSLLSAVAIALLFGAATTHFLGVHVILGAFAVGVLLAQFPLVGKKITYPLHAVTMGIFAPIFFAAAGLNVNLTVLAEPGLLQATAVFTLSACLAKILGCFLGGKLGGLGNWEALCVGLGTNARGAMGLIVGILGFSLGILTVNLFSIIVFMSLFTTAMTPPAMRWALRRVPVSEQEKTRLKQEEQQEKTFVSDIKRVLLPVVDSTPPIELLHVVRALASIRSVEVTVIHTGTGEATSEEEQPKTPLTAVTTSLKAENLTLVSRKLDGDNPANATIEAARLGYDLVAIGKARERVTTTGVYSDLVSQIIAGSPCPVLVTSGHPHRESPELKRILVPISGGGYSRRACELAVAAASALGAKVIALCVIEEPYIHLEHLRGQEELPIEVAEDLMQHVARLASVYKVEIESVIRHAMHAAPEIVRVAREHDTDLIFLGGSIRPTLRQIFSDTISHVVSDSPCAVAVLGTR